METQPNPEDPGRARRLRFDLLLPVLLRPRAALREIAAHASRSWITPLLVITLAALLLVVVGGPLRRAAAELEAMNLPPEFQYYSPEQQAQIQQARGGTPPPPPLFLFPAPTPLPKGVFGWVLGCGAPPPLF